VASRGWGVGPDRARDLPMRLASFLALAALGCGNDRSTPPAPIDLTCDGSPDPHCDHPIDRLLVPRLRALGIAPRDASKDEVCRRMAIDLLGRAPTPAERTRCASQTFAEMADVFMQSEEFTRTQRRAWGELANYQSLAVWGPDLVDLDGLVAKLYREEIDYASFTRDFVVHPAFWVLNPGDSWTANVFSIFIGRPARQDELDAARPLTIPWVGKQFAGGDVFWSWRQFYLAAGQSEATAEANALTQTYNGVKVEMASNLCLCTPSLLNAGCFSDVLGSFVKLDPICVSTTPNDPANVHRWAERTPSTDDLCGDNVTRRIECSDRGRGETAGTFTPLVVSPPMTSAMEAQWYKIGDALLRRADLWEAAADRELRKLLGWWQATFKHPDSDLPEVRALLAQQLRDGASVRDVISLIVTSQLYVQPHAAPAGDALPPWAAGPAKLLSGESWYASAVSAVGETPGTCDFRWGLTNTYEPRWSDVRLVESAPGSIDARYGANPPLWGHSIAAIQRLGGCTGDSRRAEISNVGLTFSQAGVARELCAIATSVTPAGWSGDLVAAATYLIERVWSRGAQPGEAAAMADEMNACIAANACGSPEIAARWLCVRMLDSAEFSTY